MSRGAKVERKCKCCGRPFMAREADVKRGWARCCSKSCAATITNRKTGNYQRYMAGVKSRHWYHYLDADFHGGDFCENEGPDTRDY